MYIYNKPHALRPEDGHGGGEDANVEQDPLPSPHHPQQQHQRQRPQPQHLHHSSSAAVPSALPIPSPLASAGPKSAPIDRPSKSRRHSLPFFFFQPANTSSTSLVPSTAEGRPIPLDGDTAAHRTSALRELNSTYPSPVSRHRHRYTKSSGAQSSTYSQPVIVRTYSGPSPLQYGSSPHHPYRPSSGSRGGSRRVPLPPSTARSGPSLLSGRPSKPAISGLGLPSFGNGYRSETASKNGSVTSMPRHHKAKKSSKLQLQLPLPWQWQSAAAAQEPQDEDRLPPLEAFSFKALMAAERVGDNSIEADLDRIAEICARSRYSLSNQYEVHVAPHGSGSSFVTGGGSSSSRGSRRGHGHNQSAGGPTLQAIGSDDDENNRTHRKRRNGGRRRSIAYGTLETIMSSSRSSEEDKTKKKSAAEIAEEVRGRARKNSSGSGSGCNGNGGSASQETTQASDEIRQLSNSRLARKKSASFATALMDSSRHGGPVDPTSPRASAAALISDPAQPQTSTSHLEIRTTAEGAFGDGYSDASAPESPLSDERVEVHFADELPHIEGPQPSASKGLLSGFSAWLPWTSHTDSEAVHGIQPRVNPSEAEGSLRQLLKSVDKFDKGKGADLDG